MIMRILEFATRVKWCGYIIIIINTVMFFVSRGGAVRGGAVLVTFENGGGMGRKRGARGSAVKVRSRQVGAGRGFMEGPTLLVGCAALLLTRAGGGGSAVEEQHEARGTRSFVGCSSRG
ncbi:unnamed protein product [Calypogeia fissa]